jgi:Flp pilus assembly protein TadG
MQGVRRSCRRDGGSVTAETAVVLPVVVVMLLAATWAVGVVVTHIRCLDAARDVARAVARGEPPDEARRIGERSAPAGASVDVTRDGDDVTAVVRARLDWPLVGSVREVRVEESATVQVEPADGTGGLP